METYRSNAARRWALTLLYTAIAPIPMSTFAGETTSKGGQKLPALLCRGYVWKEQLLHWPALSSRLWQPPPPAVDPNVSAVTAVWSYVGELIFNLLVLVGAVRMSDRIVKELLGL